ncbi:hypothetical protein ABPG72_001061 [Tetrahymena utriculariae]
MFSIQLSKLIKSISRQSTTGCNSDNTKNQYFKKQNKIWHLKIKNYATNNTKKPKPIDIKIKVSIKAKPIKVLLNKLSVSSGFLDKATLKPANKTPVPKAPKAIGNIQPPITKTFTAFTNNTYKLEITYPQLAHKYTFYVEKNKKKIKKQNVVQKKTDKKGKPLQISILQSCIGAIPNLIIKPIIKVKHIKSNVILSVQQLIWVLDDIIKLSIDHSVEPVNENKQIIQKTIITELKKDDQY